MMVERRLEALRAHTVARADAGDSAFARMIAEGHLALYGRDLVALAARRNGLLRALSA